MDSPLRKLTLAIPKQIKGTILDVLDDMEPALQGYSLISAQGRGPLEELGSQAEKVLGASNVVLILVILPDVRIQMVLGAVLEACQRPNISYWVEPVLDFGRLQ